MLSGIQGTSFIHPVAKLTSRALKSSTSSFCETKKEKEPLEKCMGDPLGSLLRWRVALCSHSIGLNSMPCLYLMPRKETESSCVSKK